MPVMIRMISESMATSPTMNDQWSGKILSRTLVRNRDDPNRSSTVSRPDLPTRKRFCAAARSSGGAHRPRFQKPGPDGLGVVAAGTTTYPLASVVSGSWGRERGAGPNTGLQSSSTSKVDWWQGQTSWWVCGVVEAGRAAGVGADLGEGDEAADVPADPLGRDLERAASPTLISRVGLRALSMCPSGKTVRMPLTGNVAGLAPGCRRRSRPGCPCPTGVVQVGRGVGGRARRAGRGRPGRRRLRPRPASCTGRAGGPSARPPGTGTRSRPAGPASALTS